MTATTAIAADIQQIPVNRIFYDPAINTRPPKEADVRRIGENFDPDKFGIIHVARRGRGRFVVIDGHHRVLAVRRYLGEDQCVPCQVHEGSDAALASAFAGLNDGKAVPSFYRFIARINSGDKVAVGVRDVVQAHGLRVGNGASEGNVRCVTAAERLYRQAPEALSMALGVVVEAWGPTPDALKAEIVEGVGLFLLRYGSQVDRVSLIRKLSSMSGGAAHLFALGKSVKEWRGGSVPRGVAGAIVTLYNKGRRGMTIPDWWS